MHKQTYIQICMLHVCVCECVLRNPCLPQLFLGKTNVKRETTSARIACRQRRGSDGHIFHLVCICAFHANGLCPSTNLTMCVCIRR